VSAIVPGVGRHGRWIIETPKTKNNLEAIMFITRCNPNNEIERYFPHGQGLPGLFRGLLDADGNDDAQLPAHRLPRTNVSETADAFVFTLEMPGIAKENVDVSVEGDRLTVKGGSEHKAEEKAEEKGFIRREFHANRFERSFRLGNDVDADNVKAKMLDGVLTVTLSKKQEKLGRKVDVA